MGRQVRVLNSFIRKEQAFLDTVSGMNFYNNASFMFSGHVSKTTNVCALWGPRRRPLAGLLY